MDLSHKTGFLGNDEIFPLLLRMSIPAAIAMLINALYNIVDTIFAGHGVGPIAIAALSIVFPIQMIVSAFGQSIGVGTASISSRMLGKKREEISAKAVGRALLIVSIMTLIIICLLFIYMNPVLRFFGASESIIP